MKELVNNTSRYKLVLAQNPVYAESESLTFDNGGDGSLSLKTSAEQNVTFKLKAPNKSSAKCSGKPALCYISLSVWEGYLKDKLDENGNTVKSLNYRPSVGRVDKDRLSDALRRVN